MSAISGRSKASRPVGMAMRLLSRIGTRRISLPAPPSSLIRRVAISRRHGACFWRTAPRLTSRHGGISVKFRGSQHGRFNGQPICMANFRFDPVHIPYVKTVASRNSQSFWLSFCPPTASSSSACPLGRAQMECQMKDRSSASPTSRQRSPPCKTP